MSSSSPLPRFYETPKIPSFQEKLGADMSYEVPRKEKPSRSTRNILAAVALTLAVFLLTVFFMSPSKSQIDRVPYAQRLTEE